MSLDKVNWTPQSTVSLCMCVYTHVYVYICVCVFSSPTCPHSEEIDTAALSQSKLRCINSLEWIGEFQTFSPLPLPVSLIYS